MFACLFVLLESGSMAASGCAVIRADVNAGESAEALHMLALKSGVENDRAYLQPLACA